MHALLLSLALGQAEPAVPPPAPPPEPTPATAPAAAPATSSEPSPRIMGGPALRVVDFTRLSDGAYRATLDGTPVAGAAFYRAVLRPDLAARAEEARFDRTALFIAAGLAPVAGLGLGWVAGTAQQWPLPPCLAEPAGRLDCTGHDQVAATNRSAMATALVAGGISGVATGALLWFLGSGIHPIEPTADEAEALVRAYRARAAPVPPANRPAGGASLELEAGPRAARLAFRLDF